MNVSSILTKDYENVPLRRRGKNKANSKPNKANLQNAQMNVNKVLTKDYENVPLRRRGENKPNQTQFPQITTISLFSAVNLRKEFRRFWFRYRSALLFYATHLTQNAQKKFMRILSIFLRQFNDSLPISCKLRLYLQKLSVCRAELLDKSRLIW